MEKELDYKEKKVKKTGKPAIRQDLVDYYKGKITSGEYIIKSEEIAGKIVQKIKEQPAVKPGTARAINRVFT